MERVGARPGNPCPNVYQSFDAGLVSNPITIKPRVHFQIPSAPLTATTTATITITITLTITVPAPHLRRNLSFCKVVC
jgi:hypothetical protein